MNQKPPNTRTGRSGWLGHRSARLKSLVVVGAVTLGFAGAGIAAALPASADPSFQFVEVGSDTTQYVMDAFANALGGSILASYDAVNPSTQIANEPITPEIASQTVSGAGSNCSFTRPNGSGGGYKAMSYAFTVGNGTTTLGQNGTPPQAGCVTVDRSSSPPGSVSASAGAPGSSLTTGNFVYVPYAVDDMVYATGPTTSTSETTQCVGALNSSCTGVGTNGIGTITFNAQTTIRQDLDLSVAQLTTLYKQCQSVTVGTTTLNPGTSFTFTATSGSPAVFTTATSSNLAAQQEVTLQGGSLPGGFSAQAVYYVASSPAPTATTFSLAATPTGAAINSTSAGSGTVAIPGTVDLYAPQPGSGTLAFWELIFGLTAPAACWHQVVVAGPAIGIAVEEHDGTAIASDPIGIDPFSVARWYASSTGATTDLRHGAVLQPLTSAGIGITDTGGSPDVFTATTAQSFTNGTQVTLSGTTLPGGFTAGTTYFIVGQSGSTFELSATSGGTAINATSAGTGLDVNVVVQPLNSGGTENVQQCLSGASFNQAGCGVLTRELYNVMDYYEIINVTPASGLTNNVPFNALLAAQFAGPSSGMCRDTFQIESQGFFPLTSTSSFSDACGATTNGLRVQMNNSATNG